MSRLEDEKVEIDDEQQSYYLINFLKLSEMKREILDTKVGDEHTCADIENAATRLFKRVHLTEPKGAAPPTGQRSPMLKRFLGRAPSSAASTSSGCVRSFRSASTSRSRGGGSQRPG